MICVLVIFLLQIIQFQVFGGKQASQFRKNRLISIPEKFIFICIFK